LSKGRLGALAVAYSRRRGLGLSYEPPLRSKLIFRQVPVELLKEFI